MGYYSEVVLLSEKMFRPWFNIAIGHMFPSRGPTQGTQPGGPTRASTQTA